MRQFVWFTSLALAAACSLGHAQETAGNRWPIADVAAPTTELALELYVALAPRVEVGESDDGVRQFIPITGGRFSGDGIRGEVMPGGADWQLRRRDGAVEVNALYSIRTDDGAVIVVDNRGIIVPPPPAAAGGAAAPAAGYVRDEPALPCAARQIRLAQQDRFHRHDHAGGGRRRRDHPRVPRALTHA